MVKAIEAGRKNQTRRLKGLEKINENPDDWIWISHLLSCTGNTKKPPLKLEWFFLFEHKVTKEQIRIKCPYGNPGDILWVRECFHKYESVEKGIIYSYKANHDKIAGAKIWKPSIHMPKAATRYFLQIKEISVERLMDLSRGDSMAEGCPFPNWAQGDDPKTWFFELWESINGKDSLELNPWVWVIEFEKIEKPENFK